VSAKTKERPILFSGPLVRAILRDVDPKTVTRRLVKPMPGLQSTWMNERFLRLASVRGYAVVEGRFGVSWEHPGGGPGGWTACPYGGPGDRLWVRETWADADIMYQGHQNDSPSVVAYRADKSAIQYEAAKPMAVPAFDLAQWNWDALKWRPSIHMPRWASRVTLEIVSVRVERLQDITEEDAKREGITEIFSDVFDGGLGRAMATTPRAAFSKLWNEINEKRPGASWKSNPWVWRIEFRRIKP
jgi:hypothetical protein